MDMIFLVEKGGFARAELVTARRIKNARLEGEARAKQYSSGVFLLSFHNLSASLFIRPAWRQAGQLSVLFRQKPSAGHNGNRHLHRIIRR